MEALNVVENLGGDYLGGVIFSALGKYKFPPTKKARDNAVAALKRLAIAAQSKGITLGLEPVNRYESNLLNTGSQALEMIKDIDESNVLVHLDIYHMNIEEQDLVSPVIEAGNKLGYVHIGASHRGPLGTGNIDFDSFLEHLLKLVIKAQLPLNRFHQP